MKENILSILSFLFDSVILLFFTKSQREKIENTNSKKTLALVRADAIGDFVLWSSTFADLEILYPKKQYDWVLVGNSAWTELARNLGVFKAVSEINVSQFRKKIGYRKNTIIQLQLIKADILLHPTYSRDFRVGDSWSRAISAPVKIASVGDMSHSSKSGQTLSARLYSRLLPAEDRAADDPMMELARNAEFLSALSGKSISTRLPDFRAIADHSEFNVPSEPYFVISPAASWSGREWPIQSFIEVADKVQKQRGWLCVWVGSTADEKRFSTKIKNSALRSLNLVGKTNLSDLARILGRANLVLSNETAAAHLGGACRVPTLSILGGGHYGRFLPWKQQTEVSNLISCVTIPMSCFHCNWHCRYEVAHGQAVPCIREIGVESVLKALPLEPLTKA